MSLSSLHSSRLHFAHRANPTDKWTDLNIDLIEWPRQFRIADEEALNEFRAGQIQLTLKEDRQTYSLSGGDEIAVFSGPPADHGSLTGALWSGTIDPAEIRRDEITHRLTFRVLQHGSLLNTVFAGLPDWTLDENGVVVYDFSKFYRYKGTADNWARFDQAGGSGGDFDRNEIVQEDTEVFYTPSAKEALEDELYRAKFAERIYHFHTAGVSLGTVEYPYPQINEDTDEGDIRWTGQFKPHYRPDFTKPPEDWEDQGGIVHDDGAYLRNQNPALPMRRQSVQSILQYLITQFNQTARFPLQFDPDQDCILISPQIQQQIEIIERQQDVDNIDLQYYPATTFVQERVLVLVNWKDEQLLLDPLRQIGKNRFSLYSIDNETELTPIADNVSVDNLSPSYCWPTFGRNFRFARTSTVTLGSTFAAIYTMRYQLGAMLGEIDNRHLRFDLVAFIVTLSNLNITGPFGGNIVEELGEYTDNPDSLVINRSATIGSNGSAFVRQQATPYDPLPPEFEPQFTTTVNGRIYRSANGGLTVSGALFDRVAVDAENVKLSALISDLAKVTFSRWFITPGRRFKFLSRQAPGTRRTIDSQSLRRPFETIARSFEKESAPTIGNGIVLPNNARQALKNWYEDNVLPISTTGGNIAVTRSDLPEVNLTDEIHLTGEPNIGNPALVKSIDIQDENTLLIRTEQVLSI